MDLLTSLVGANKLGGWVRAIVASALGTAIAKWPMLSDYLDPSAQTALGVVASSVAVGAWSHLAKSLTSANADAAIKSQPGIKGQ